MTLALDIDPPPEPSDLGTVIREARERRGMRQVDLAAAIHVGLSSVSAWERGVASPSAAVLPLLAEALGVTLEADADGFAALDAAPTADAPRVVVVVAGTAEAMDAALDRLGVPRAD